MAFCLCLGFSIKKINGAIFKFSSTPPPPPPLKHFLREAYKVSANELMIHVLICIYMSILQVLIPVLMEIGMTAL